MTRKMVVMIAIALSAGLMASLAVAANQPVTIIINGKTLECDTQAQVIDNRTMVPVGVIAQGLGADVSWDAVNNTVLITSEPHLKLLKVNGEQTTWPYWYVNGRIYMEQRNLIELLRLKYQMPWYSVLYSPGSQAIYINGQVNNVESLEQDGFVTIPLDRLKRKNALTYDFDPETGSLTVDINQKY